MHLKNIDLDENAKNLIKKCEDKKIDKNVMRACQVLLEEINREKPDLGEINPDISYLMMAQEIAARNIPKILMMAFKIKKRPNLEPELKVAADRLIRVIEAL